MARFFEGGQQGIRKAQENVRASHRIPKTIKNIANDTAKQVSRETTARQAQRQYSTGTPSRDANIIKSVVDIINSPAQEQSGLVKPPTAPSGGFIFKGQYGGAGTQARQTFNSILPDPGNMRELAQFAARRDTAKTAEEMKFYDEHSLPHSKTGPDAHDLMIGRGQQWMTDSEALTNWILGGVDPSVGLTEQEYNEACARQQQYEDYMDKYLRGVLTYNPETGMARIEQQFTEDAPLPPWIDSNLANSNTWEYYKTYAHDVVQSTVDDFAQVRQEQKDFAKHPYKSAFSTDHKESDIDSFLDIAISSRSLNDLKTNTKNYFRDYIINPIRAGHVLTAGGNALWNMMDTMDIASRGVRAFTAGDSVLGGTGRTDIKTSRNFKGTGNTFLGDNLQVDSEKTKVVEGKDSTFKGQNVYWAKLDGHSQEEIERAQRIFMQNGGYALLLKHHPGEAGKDMLGSREMSMSDEELMKHLDEVFAEENIGWKDIYNDIESNFFTKNKSIDDLKQGIENVKLTYSDPEAAFHSDTGSMGADIIIESVLDPGLMLGGISKNISKNTLASSAEVAFRDGFLQIFDNNMDDVAEIMRHKRVRSALKSFIGSNEGKNIIFKNSKDFGNDVNVLLKTLEHDVPGIFADASEKKLFADTISAHLFSKNQNINTKIIESTGWARNAIDDKTFRAAYWMDRSIDAIDSAIIKSSFAAPWGLVKAVKGGKRFLIDYTAVGKYYYGKRLRQSVAAAAVRDEATKAVDATRLPDLFDKFDKGLIDEDGVRLGLRDVTKQFDDTSRMLPKLTSAFADGRITAEEVVQVLGERIKSFTGGKYSTVDELRAIVDSQAVRNAGDLSAAYDRLVRCYKTLDDLIYRKSDAAVADFLTEVSHIDNMDDLRRLFKDNMDNEIIMSLRDEVLNRSPIKDLRRIDINKMVSQILSGEASIDGTELRSAVRAVEHASNETVERVVKVRDIKRLIQHNYSYLLESNDSYVKKLEPLFSLQHGSKNEITLDDAIACIESAKRSLLTSEHLKTDVITGTTAGRIHSDPRMADLRRLKDTIRGLDIISLKDNEVVTIMHVDRMAMMRKFMDSPAIVKAYGADYDAIIAPVMDMLDSKSLDNVDLVSDTLVQDLLHIRELKYGRDRTNILIKEFQSIHTLSDNKLHALLNGLGNNFGRPYGTLTDMVSSPGLLRRNLETTARTQGGTPKVGIAGLTDILKSVDSEAPSEFVEPYIKEFEDPVKGPILKAKYDSIVNASALDSTSYVKKQMLASLMMDPSMAVEYNARYAAGNTPIFYHVNTSGLNTELNEITSISCIKWTPIEVSDTDPLTLEKILDAIPEEPILFKQGMSDAQIDGISENVLRKMDLKGLSSTQLRDVARTMYGTSEMVPTKSESDIIEEFCAFLQDEVVVKKLGKGFRRSTEVKVPSLVVHDLDGFNIPYFNKRAAEALQSLPENSKTQGYFEGLSKSIQSASDNTYNRLAYKAGDNSFTEEELDQIEKILRNYINDINDFSVENFDPFDFVEYGKTFERIIYNATSPVDDELAGIRKAIVDASSGSAVNIEAYKHAVQNVSDFAKYPKRFAFMSSGTAENEVSRALKLVGKDSINIESRIYVKDVMSFFDVTDPVTGQLKSNIGSLEKMHRLSQYVIRNRDYAMVSGAEEFLAPRKAEFDALIEAVRNIGKEYSSGSEYSFLAGLKTPSTAVESYLLSQKLYDDYIRFWCFSDVAENISDKIDVLNSLKTKLKETYIKAKQSHWDKFRSAKQSEMDAYMELNDALWEEYFIEGDFVNDLYRKAKSGTEHIWEEFRIDKEYAQMLKQEAKAESAHLWDDYRIKKKQLDDWYKKLKTETDRVVTSWKESKSYRQKASKPSIEELSSKASKSIKRSVKSVLKDTSFNRNEVNTIVGDFDDISKRAVELMINDEDAEAGKLLYDSVRDIISKSVRTDNTAYQESKLFRDFLRTTPINPDEILKGDVKDFNAFRKRNFGRLKFKKGGLSYDQFVDEIYTQFPEYFGDEAFEGPSGLLSYLENKIDSLKPKRVSIPDDEQEYLVDQLTNELYDALRLEADKLKNTQLSWEDVIFKPYDTSNLEYFKSYADYRKAFNAIDWKSYKSAKDSFKKYREFLLQRQDEIYKEYLDHINTMRNKYDFESMSDATNKLWGKYKEAAEAKTAKKIWTKEQSNLLREMRDASIDDLFIEFRDEAKLLYKNLPERDEIFEEYFQELMDYFNTYRARIFDEFTNGWYEYGFEQFRSQDYNEIFKLLDGEKRPELFKSAVESDYSKTVYSYRDGVLKEGIDKATKLSEANATVSSRLRQLDWIDRYYINAGINTQTDRLTGMVHMKAKLLYDMLDATGVSERPSFQEFIMKASEAYHLKLQQYALDSLRVDGKFNQQRLVSELVYNNFNHIVFNSHAYSVSEMDELIDSVKGFINDGADYLSYYEDRTTGNVYIYLNYNAHITSDGTRRFINGVEAFDKPVKDVVKFSDFDELKSVLDLDDIEDFRDIYKLLEACWDDVHILSEGAINGTSGKIVSRRHAEEYFKTLPSQLGDMLSPKEMLLADTARGVVYDPGFIRNEDSDILLDFLDTLSRQADVAKEDVVLINEVFTNNSSLKFNELSAHFSDEELITYFKENPDYVVVSLVPNANTRTGLEVRQLKLDNLTSIKVAKEAQNTTILPYDMYYEIAGTMNRTSSEGYYRRLLGKYLLLYKAFALVKPGTWVRNYIDATTKTALDDGHDLTNVFSILPYQAQAVRNLGAYSRILKADPALLTKSNWEIIQRTFKTDMTFEDFELLRGVMDVDRFKSADKYFLNKNTMKRGGQQIISGEGAGLRGLDEKDITTAFKKYLGKEAELPLSQNDFIDIYLGRVKASDEVMEQFEDMMRTLSINMRNAEASTIFDKTVSTMFKPFGAVEGVVRYAQTMYLKDQGLSQNQILKRIHMTQFYNAPSWGTFGKLETIMPFITFRYNNFMYWMRMMDENPRFFKYFEDVYGTIANEDIENLITEEQDTEYGEDTFFQNGAVPIGDTGAYIKIGNSFLSAINDFYGGPDMFLGKYGGLNPLLRETLRFSGYALGLNSKEFFSDVDWDISKDVTTEGLLGLVPGGNLAMQAYKFVNQLPSTFTDGGPSMDTLFSTLSFIGVLGIRKNYTYGAATDFQSWQDELEKQGKWYDANLGKIVDISEKNTYGANDPNNSWEDVQAYMMVHFGKMWDPNQHKFVKPEDMVDGNFNVDFDFENDPEAWNKLQQYMKMQGKIYDFNQRKFVYEEDYISGGLNDENLTFKERSALMYDKFGLLWDGNQNTFVDQEHYISGGLNDTKNFNEVKSLRLALYGETWDQAQHKFVKTAEPSVVTVGNFFGGEEYDEYFSRLGIPRLQNADVGFHVSREGFLVTDDGRYILTKNADYNAQVFDKFKHSYGGRSYNGWKRYSHWKLFDYNKKPYKGRTLPSRYYTGYGWNDIEGYYRFNFQYNYRYHNPNPASKLNRLSSPKINYPYGGEYNKYSFYTR